MTVGQRIKTKREELGLSQGDLAKKMGISRQAISKAELYGDNITTDKVSKFAQALNVSVAYLMGWEDPAPEPNATLTLTEQQLIDAYRNGDAVTRNMIERILAFNNIKDDL